MQRIFRSGISFLEGAAWRRYLVLFLLGFLLRLPVIFLALANPARATPPGDAPGYYQLATNLFLHGVFSPSSAAPFQPDPFRTPGYPLFLALIFFLAGSSTLAVVFVQSLLHAVTGLVIVRLGEKVLGSLHIGVIGCVLWMIAPLPAIFAGLLLSEILFTAFFLVLLLVLTETRLVYSAFGGALLGAAILIRPIGIFLWPSLIPALCLGIGWRRAIAKCALFSVMVAAVIAPWLYRNYLIFGRVTLETVQSNLLYYNAAGYITWRDGISLGEARDAATRYYQQYLAEKGLHPATAVEESDAMYSAAIRMLLADPLRAIWFNALNSLNGLRPGASYLIMYLDPGKINPDSVTNGELSPAISNINRPEILLVTVILSVFYGLLYLLSAIGILQLLWDRKWMALALLVVPCILIMYIPALASNARFRIPIEPILCLMAALALGKAIPSIIKHFSKRTSVPLSQ
jgi:hypothetical protein